MTAAMLPVRRPRSVPGPFRRRPDQGQPVCLLEKLAQYIWRRKLSFYIAAVATASLIVQLLATGASWR